MTLRSEVEELVANATTDVTLLEPFTDREMKAFEEQLGVPLPDSIRELLSLCSGLRSPGWDVGEVRFNGLGRFRLEGILPTAVDIAADGFGNFFAVDVTETGWSPVLFISHDPCALVVRGTDVAEFLRLIFKGREGAAARAAADDVPFEEIGMELEMAQASPDAVLRDVAGRCSPGTRLVDLRAKSEGSGIGCNRFDDVRRLSSELLFEVRSPKRRENIRPWGWLPWRR